MATCNSGRAQTNVVVVKYNVLPSGGGSNGGGKGDIENCKGCVSMRGTLFDGMDGDRWRIRADLSVSGKRPINRDRIVDPMCAGGVEGRRIQSRMFATGTHDNAIA